MSRNKLIDFRRDTFSNWSTINPVLISGEPAFDTTNNTLKIGDGSSTYNNLSGWIQASGYNYIINPCFEINQRANASINSNATFPVDRWKSCGSGSTFVASQQTFTLGQTDVPGEPKNFLRTVVTSIAGTGNYAFILQAIESVRTLAGKTVTLSFKGKADAAKPIAVEFIQNFGTGGSPSVSVTGIGSTKLNLTPSWSTQKVTITLPSIFGKTVGSNGDDYLLIAFWFDAGSDFNSRTGSLGQQSGTFDIANVKLEEGSVATPFIVPRYADELIKCRRYFRNFNSGKNSYGHIGGTGMCFYGTAAYIPCELPVPMRVIPSLSQKGSLALYANNASLLAITSLVIDGSSTTDIIILVAYVASGLTLGDSTQLLTNNSTSADVWLDAEL